MKSLDLRQELVNRYGKRNWFLKMFAIIFGYCKQFDTSRNWCSKLLNSKKMEIEEITVLLYYLRSFVYANLDFIKIARRINKIGQADASLFLVAESLGEILVRLENGVHQVISSQKYMDETGVCYTPRQIISRCLYFATEGQNDCDLLFGRSRRSERLTRQYMKENQKPVIVLMIEDGRLNYYMISSSLLS